MPLREPDPRWPWGFELLTDVGTQWEKWTLSGPATATKVESETNARYAAIALWGKDYDRTRVRVVDLAEAVKRHNEEV